MLIEGELVGTRILIIQCICAQFLGMQGKENGSFDNFGNLEYI